MEVKRGYKQTEAGVIPNDWVSTTVREIASPIRNAIVGGPFGSDLVSKDYVEVGVPVVRGQNMDGRFLSGEFACVTEAKARSLEANLARPGDLIFTQRGTLGQVSLVPTHPHERYLVSQSQMKLTVDRNVADPLFFYYLFTSAEQQKFIRLNTIQTGVPHINLGILRTIPVQRPPLAEQVAIAKALSDADALLESLDQLLTKKRQVKQAAAQKLLRPKTGTEERLLRDVSSLKGRIGWQGLKQAEFTTNEDEPFLITGMNFKDGAIRWSEVYHISDARYELAPEIQLRPGDVLMTKDGTIGKVLYIDAIPHPGKASLNSHLLLFRPIRGGYHPKYLYYQLGSQRFKDFVEQSKSGTTFFGLSQAAVGAYPVLLPPMEDQVRIAALLSNLDADIAALEAKIAKVRQIKQGMMQELLTGRIRLV